MGLCLTWVLLGERKSSHADTWGFLLPHPSDSGCRSVLPGPSRSKAEHQSPRRQCSHLVYTCPRGSTQAEHPSNQRRSHGHKNHMGATWVARPHPSPPAAQGGRGLVGQSHTPTPRPMGRRTPVCPPTRSRPQAHHGPTAGHWALFSPSPAPALGLSTLWFPTHRLVPPVFAHRSQTE